MQPPPEIAVVLPPRETFSPQGGGAIALLAHRLARVPSGFLPTVYGTATPEPFAEVAFRPVALAWRPGRHADRYAAGVARRLAQRPPALIEVHNRPDVALSLARRFPRVPVSLFLHNDPHGMRAARSGAERTALLATLARVVTVSRYLAGRLPAGAVVLPNCVDLSAIPPSPPVRERRVLFAGRVVADKGADSFVGACARALPQLCGWDADMIGADRFGPDSPDTPFLRRLRPAAEAARVALSGWQPHAAVMAAMARAAMVVVPSRWPEPFGLTALEAMAAGAAVLCSPRGGLAEVVGDAAVMIDPDDPAAIAEAIVALARDPARRAALGEAGRRRAETFDVAHAAAALERLRRATLAAWPSAAAHPI